VRSYRVSGKKLERVIGFESHIPVEDSVKHMVQEIRAHGLTDFDNPRYYNIRWMQLLEEAQETIRITGDVFDLPSARHEKVRLVDSQKRLKPIPEQDTSGGGR
jgi:hypothetical protein